MCILIPQILSNLQCQVTIFLQVLGSSEQKVLLYLRHEEDISLQ